MKTFFTRQQGACVLPVQGGTPDWQEGVVNSQGVSDAVVGFQLDRLN